MTSPPDRKLTYSLAINEAIHQMMAEDESVFLVGQGVKSPWYVGNTATGLLERFGPTRIIDTPVSENGVTGAAVGAAMAGMRPIVVHPRADFAMYALDPIINEAANWHYMNGGKVSVPVVVWAIINRGGEQAAQHSQAIHALFSHIPGLKVVMPATPYDAKGLMIAAIRDPNPVIFMDDRWLYGIEGTVPKEPYEVPIGKAAVLREGHDLTMAAISYMVPEAMTAASELEKEGVTAEVIDLRSAKPLDTQTLVESVRKTGRLLVADPGWTTCGLSGEVVSLAVEGAFDRLKAPVLRVALPDCPAPASRTLEAAFFPRSGRILEKAKELLAWERRVP